MSTLDFFTESPPLLHDKFHHTGTFSDELLFKLLCGETCHVFYIYIGKASNQFDIEII